jgi:ATP-dependent DNA helicase
MDKPKMSYTRLREEQMLAAEEEKARAENEKAEEKRKKKWKKRVLSKEEREAKAKDLDQLLAQSAAFSSILTNKTEVLGRVGTSLDGKAIGEHDLTMAKQPKCLVGGTMRDYQLEGLTWMYEICIQGMSGILADEMGLGMTSDSEQQPSGLTRLRQNCPDNIPHCAAARAGELPWATSHCRSPEHPL